MTIVRETIARAARRAGRDPSSVRIVAVTKGVPVTRMLEALEAGLTDLGESRVQEALAKIGEVGHPVRWHLVGPLQTNKARHAARIFDMIHSVDRLELARELDRRAGLAGRRLEVLVQVNLSGEAGRHGLPPERLHPLLEAMGALANLHVKGLMTIAPLGRDPRPVFARLRELYETARHRGFPGVDMEYLSMGMSDDYPQAVEEGANLVRLGRAIFG